MKTFKNIGSGLGDYAKALSIIFNNGLWYFFLFPLVLNIAIYFAGMFGINILTDIVEKWLAKIISLDGATFWGVAYLKGFLSGFIWVVFKIVFFIVFTTIGGYIIIMLLSPVFAILSEKTETILTGNKYPFNGDQLMRDIVRGVLIASRNMLIEIVYMVLLFMVSYIPIIGQFAALALFIISCYFYGFTFIDYTNERRRLKIKKSVYFIRKNKGVAIGNGFVFALFLLIPFCGTTLAGFVAIVSVVAATISTHKIVDLSKNPYAKKNKQIED